MKRAVKGLFANFGLEISKLKPKYEKTRFSTPYEVALLTLLSEKKRLRIAQVGANDGAVDDPLHNFVSLATDQTEICLIEPQQHLIPYLTKNYEFHPSKAIFNGAVGVRGELELYVVKQSYWSRLHVPYAKGWPEYSAPSGVTSSDRNHVRKWLEQYLKKGNDIDDAIDVLRVPSLPLPDILQSLGILGEIDVLQVDTEGFDDQIIYNSDIGALKPQLINFEAKHLPAKRYDELKIFLRDHGYLIARWQGDALAIQMAAAGALNLS